MSVEIREKSYFGEKFRVPGIVYCPTLKSDNSELGKCIFYGIVLTLGFERTGQTWTMISELKALVDSEKFRVTVFGYRAQN